MGFRFNQEAQTIWEMSILLTLVCGLTKPFHEFLKVISATANAGGVSETLSLLPN